MPSNIDQLLLKEERSQGPLKARILTWLHVDFLLDDSSITFQVGQPVSKHQLPAGTIQGEDSPSLNISVRVVEGCLYIDDYKADALNQYVYPISRIREIRARRDEHELDQENNSPATQE